MMISTKGRYALRVLVDLAEHSDQGYIPLKEIADRQGISEKYLESILKTLVRNKYLSGLRGKGGGYRLALPPEECTVGEILRMTEETTAPVACLAEGAAECPRAEKCRTLPLWRGLDRVVNEYLDSVTLAQLVRPAQEPEDQPAPGQC